VNLDHPHLAPQAAALMNMTDDLRIRAIRTDRWIGFWRAKVALERLQFLCEHPPSTRPPGLAIYAPSGMGKTMLVEKFRRTNPPTVDTVGGAETVPVLSISLSSKPSERRVYAQLLSGSGASLRHAMTLVEMEVRALLILKQLKVRVIVIDEVHNLLAGSPREQRVILQLFRHLSNELKASLVFLGIADAREAIAGDGLIFPV
jgi:Cdc6-like AAA superfamily ATPase